MSSDAERPQNSITPSILAEIRVGRRPKRERERERGKGRGERDERGMRETKRRREKGNEL
jgi:hypothetical protein